MARDAPEEWSLPGQAILGQQPAETRRHLIELAHPDGVLPPEDRLHARELALVSQEQPNDHRALRAAQALNRGRHRLRAFVLSGSRAVLPPTRPLRTVHEPFDSHGSSLSVAPYGTRFLNVQTSAMDLSMAVGVKKHTVFVAV